MSSERLIQGQVVYEELIKTIKSEFPELYYENLAQVFMPYAPNFPS